MQKSNIVLATACAVAALLFMWFPTIALTLAVIIAAFQFVKWVFGPTDLHTRVTAALPEEKRSILGTALCSGFIALALSWYFGLVAALVAAALVFYLIEYVHRRHTAATLEQAKLDEAAAKMAHPTSSPSI